jgi:hypothetical protein
MRLSSFHAFDTCLEKKGLVAPICPFLLVPPVGVQGTHPRAKQPVRFVPIKIFERAVNRLVCVGVYFAVAHIPAHAHTVMFLMGLFKAIQHARTLCCDLISGDDKQVAKS